MSPGSNPLNTYLLRSVFSLYLRAHREAEWRQYSIWRAAKRMQSLTNRG
jgi:hypothetical protein